MNLNAFYEPGDANRLSRTLSLLARHDLTSWALTGGTAIEWYLRKMGAAAHVRPLHDLDFIAASFDCLPAGLGDVLLSRHVHPHDPPAKTMLQAVDPGTSVRIDVFRAYGNELERVRWIVLNKYVLRIVCFEDLVSRHARLCCDLLRGEPVAPKFARDFMRMVDLADVRYIEHVWQEHRKSEDPISFAEVTALLREAIGTRADLLIAPVYSTDLGEVCLRCESTTHFQLAEAGQVLSLLGYC